MTTQIDPLTAPLEQLQAFRQQQAEDVETIASSYSQLKAVQSKYNEGFQSVQSLTKPNEGELANVDHVIVDVGTGYFVSKSVSDAKDYYKGKIDYIQKQLNGLQETLTDRQKRVNDLTELINLRINMDKQGAGKAAA
ncbi:Prefoldin subunit 5 [Borealophlyctis nickersoniae]|nr:Prefoldin subunit 5 [Borealophlyctis nickersoniae]